MKKILESGVVIDTKVIAPAKLTPAQDAQKEQKLFVSYFKDDARRTDVVVIELPTNGNIDEVTQPEVLAAAKWMKKILSDNHGKYRCFEVVQWEPRLSGNLGFYLKPGLVKLKSVPQDTLDTIQAWLNTWYPQAKPANGAPANNSNAPAAPAGNGNAPANNGNTPAGNGNAPATPAGNGNAPAAPANNGNTPAGNGNAPAGNGNTPAGNAPAAPTNNGNAPAGNRNSGGNNGGGASTPANTGAQPLPSQTEIDAAFGAALFRNLYAQMRNSSCNSNGNGNN